jgi:hypothetical protein
MDEFESQRFLEALRQHAQLAHARTYAYFLPMLESLQDVAVADCKVDATSVQLLVSDTCLVCCCSYRSVPLPPLQSRIPTFLGRDF